MEEALRARLAEAVRSFHIPRLHEIPDVGLYLEQVTRYVNGVLEGCGIPPLTASMVSNYVKQHIIPGPEKKAYRAESIAYLIFVACVKNVVSMEDIRSLIDIQKGSYEFEVAYNYFCAEFENLMQVIFGCREKSEQVGISQSNEKELLRAALLSVTFKLYLDTTFRLLQEE